MNRLLLLLCIIKRIKCENVENDHAYFRALYLEDYIKKTGTAQQMNWLYAIFFLNRIYLIQNGGPIKWCSDAAVI